MPNRGDDASTLEPALVAARGLCRLRLRRDGCLPLPVRKALWRGLYPGTLATDLRLGRLRHILLDTLAIQRVLPIWQAAYPGDRRPEDMLWHAHDAFTGRLPPDRAERIADAFHVAIVDDLMPAAGQVPAMLVGQAAAALLSRAAWPTLPNPASDADDADLDPESLDPSVLAAWAEAGGIPGSIGHDRTRLVAFWSWYVEHAMPMAVDRASHAADVPIAGGSAPTVG